MDTIIETKKIQLEKTRFSPEGSCPLIYKAGEDPEVLASYVSNNMQQIKRDLLESGAILFRGFNIHSVEKFEQIVSLFIDSQVEYVGGATPRKQLSEKVATSTEFPKDQVIRLHNELSIENSPPEILLFNCLQAAETGGQTPLADVARVFEYIDPEVITEFENRKGWKLIRNFGMGFGPSVEQGFGSTDLDVIKHACATRELELEVFSPSLLRTTQYNQAVHRHPKSGIALWFNHVAFWHTSSMPKQNYEFMANAFAPEEFPYMVLFGDGSTIPDSYVENIRQAYDQAEILFPWENGDVLLVDNYRVAHGRKSFTGDRLVIVSMGNSRVY